MKRDLKEKGEKTFLFVFFFFFIFYIFFALKSVYGGDSGDLITAAWHWGIPHPPGYPLYTLLSSLFIHIIKLKTPAWRLALLSAFFSSLTLTLFYIFLKKYFKEKWQIVCGLSVLAFLYPFWLYSEVAEVFSLNNFLSLLFVYVFFIFLKNPSLKNFYFLGLVFGLGLSHHHTIILFLPAVFFLVYKKRKELEKFFSFKNLFFLVLGVFSGACFYIYPLLTCRRLPLFCWDDPVNFKNLMHLFLRKDYGTFLATVQIGNKPLFRFLSLKTFFSFFYADFSIMGIILIILGIFHLYKREKDLFSFIFLSILTFLYFIYYASFLLINDFMIATVERFFILPYIFFSIVLCFGIKEAYLIFQRLFNFLKFLQPISIRILKKSIICLFFFLPFSLLAANLPKIWALKNDMTAEKMSSDLISFLPKKSVVFLSSDTSVFNTEYYHYVLNNEKFPLVLSYPKLPMAFYKKALKKHFGELKLSDKTSHEENFKEFIEKNKNEFSIFTDLRTPPLNNKWLPYGLLWRYVDDPEKEATAEVIARNKGIFAKLNNPLSESLGKAKNLFLADILRIYANGYFFFADFLKKNGKSDDALFYFAKAEEYNPYDFSLLLAYGELLFEKKECQKAKEKFLQALEIDSRNPLVLGFLNLTERECFSNEKEAKKYEEKCLEMQKNKNIKIE